MEIYLIRHAQSTNNALADEHQRVCDPQITELGHRQAERVGRHLAQGVNLEMTVGASEEETHVRKQRGYGLTRLYCSAMTRSMQTAAYISRETGLTAEIWLDLHEIGGIYDGHPDLENMVGRPGKTRAEIEQEFPGFIIPDEVSNDGWWNRPYEDWPTAAGRAVRVAEALRKMATTAAKDERIALVTHGGFMDALLKALTNQLPSTPVFFYHFNTAITRLDLHPDGFMGIRYLNRVPHLSETPELVT
ncbi:MAG: histidine phosphatase family protein [Chloroflexi bacterium]|nr:MAG: histidine phosphatase family protein [Chloroflexota bacterium]